MAEVKPKRMPPPNSLKNIRKTTPQSEKVTPYLTEKGTFRQFKELRSKLKRQYPPWDAYTLACIEFDVMHLADHPLTPEEIQAKKESIQRKREGESAMNEQETQEAAEAEAFFESAPDVGHDFDYADALQWAMTNSVRANIRLAEAPKPAYWALWNLSQKNPAKFHDIARAVLIKQGSTGEKSEDAAADEMDADELEDLLRRVSS